jgi:hypothetical protein
MVLMIEQTSSDVQRVLKLAGTIGSDGVQMLKACIGDDDLRALDLSQVQLVDLDAVRFLAALERRGVELRDCRPHVRAWITAETPRIGDLE